MCGWRGERYEHVGVLCVSMCIGGGIKQGCVGWGVLEVQILKASNLPNPSHPEGNHSVNPFRVTPTGLPHIEPVFTQGMLLYLWSEKSLVIAEISSDQGHRVCSENIVSAQLPENSLYIPENSLLEVESPRTKCHCLSLTATWPT